MFRRKKKRLVKNLETNLYAGKYGGWVEYRDANRFANYKEARVVAVALSMVTLQRVTVEKEA